MRMHTIPQNVTAYEDRIVGMLVGRQFIYLAIGGVIIFVLLSTNVGPILIRGFISLLVGGFAAALALFKPNDRNFDALMLSYVRAIFGPTEWVWRKDELPLDKLRLITDQLAGKPPVDNQSPSLKAARNNQDNLLRVSRFQTFISERETGMDNEEFEFIEQLNFSEPVPQKAFETLSSTQKAPPMLTKQNYAQVKLAPAPTPAPAAPLPPQNRPQPVTALAGNANQLGASITVAGRQQGVRLRSNISTNRSLSRQLLSSGIVTLPVRGERHFDLSDELKDELKEITTYMQTTNVQPKAPTKLISGAPIQASAPTAVSQPKINITLPAPVTKPSPTVNPTPKTERTKRLSDYDSTATSSLSQQISMLSQALPNSGITKGSSMSDSTSSNTPNPVNNQSTPAQPDPVKVVQSPAPNPTIPDSKLEQEAQRIEAEAKQAMAELPQTAPNPPAISTPSTAPQSQVNSTQYETEINRLKAHSLEMEQKAQQAEQALQQLQQQMANQPQSGHPAIGAQQELVNQFRQQQSQSDAYRQELEQKKATEASQPHLHAEYAPLPQVSPVISEQPPAPTTSQPEANPQPTPQLQDATPPPAEPSTPAPSMQQPQESGALDLQAKMAAAGVGAAEQVATSSSTPGTTQADSTATQQKTVALTNQPNIINGMVVDAQGQFIPGVIVVVKNAQGESKRALKTNKLGQFVVTTPLANGSYSVEVDKKGLSFDIIKVELTGTVLPPTVIKSKSS